MSDLSVQKNTKARLLCLALEKEGFFQGESEVWEA